MPAKIALILLLIIVILAADRPPWRARRRPGVIHNRMAAQRVSITDWPPEPESPEIVDVDRFAKALRMLCGWMPRNRSHRYAKWILSAAKEFGEDPFLIGGLIYRESRCHPRREELGGIGLTLLVPNMYKPWIKSRIYHYRVHSSNKWERRELSLSRFPFTEYKLAQAESNIYFTSGLLSAWRDQHATVDSWFEQVPHRHYISHWVWGDKVRSARAEDRILTDRRRLLQYYGVHQSTESINREGLLLASPLDGAPRVVSSVMGSMRSGGRTHRGVDIESEFGEPVRVIADGRVVFSGIDLPGNHHNKIMEPEDTNAFDRKMLGRGGRYICVLHPRKESEPLMSCYMHLETVEVSRDTFLVRGQRIGTVGRTGMRRSSPHLHLEVHTSNRLYDPLKLLYGYLTGHPTTISNPKLGHTKPHDREID